MVSIKNITKDDIKNKKAPIKELFYYLYKFYLLINRRQAYTGQLIGESHKSLIISN